jgi:hypothetical protein
MGASAGRAEAEADTGTRAFRAAAEVPTLGVVAGNGAGSARPEATAM